MRTSIFFAVSILLFSMYSCSFLDDLRKAEHINEQEYKKMVSNARLFVLERQKDLSSEDRNIITNDKPSFGVYYIGLKHGQFGLTWKISSNRKLSVIGYGKLIDPKSLRRIEIKSVVMPGSDPI